MTITIAPAASQVAPCSFRQPRRAMATTVSQPRSPCRVGRFVRTVSSQLQDDVMVLPRARQRSTMEESYPVSGARRLHQDTLRSGKRAVRAPFWAQLGLFFGPIPFGTN